MKKLITVMFLSGFIASVAVANHCTPEHAAKGAEKAACCSVEKKKSCCSSEKKSCCAKKEKADKKECGDECKKPCCSKKS